MSALPLSNAQMLKIEGGGFAEDYDTPEGADTARWVGETDAYLREELLTSVTGRARDEVQVTRLTVPLTPGELAQRGDDITYRYAGDTITRTLRNLEEFRIVGTATFTFWEE